MALPEFSRQIEINNIQRGRVIYSSSSLRVVEAVNGPLQNHNLPWLLFIPDIHDKPLARPIRGNHGGLATVERFNEVLDRQLGKRYNMWVAQYKPLPKNFNGDINVQTSRDLYEFLINIDEITKKQYPEIYGAMPVIHAVGESMGALLLSSLYTSDVITHLKNGFEENTDPYKYIKSLHFFNIPYTDDLPLGYRLPAETLEFLYPRNGKESFFVSVGTLISTLAIATGDRHLGALEPISKKMILFYWRNILEILTLNNITKKDINTNRNKLSNGIQFVKERVPPSFLYYQEGDRHYRGGTPSRLLSLYEALIKSGVTQKIELTGSSDPHFSMMGFNGHENSFNPLRLHVLGH